MSRTIEHADVTGSEWRSAELPELIHELGRLGYRVLGRVVQRSGGGSDSQFDREERARLHAWRARPAATMLAAGDGEAFVTVDKYGDAPTLRFRTAFTDGTLVETVGVTSDGILRPRPGLDPFEGFTVGDAAGRSIELRDGPDDRRGRGSPPRPGPQRRRSLPIPVTTAAWPTPSRSGTTRPATRSRPHAR